MSTSTANKTSKITRATTTMILLNSSSSSSSVFYRAVWVVFVLVLATMIGTGGNRSSSGGALAFVVVTNTFPSISRASSFSSSLISTSRSLTDLKSISKTKSRLDMVRNRGLEIREEGATPTPGDMVLYVKAGPDGTSVGDCPFAHYVRMVLHEKNLPYDLRPSTSETKPSWLVDHYGGSMPALRHRKECYVESDVIAQYLDFFFDEPSSLSGGTIKVNTKKDVEVARACTDGFFPALARYLKHDEQQQSGGEDDDLKVALEGALQKLEERLGGGTVGGEERTGPYLVGNGEEFTLLDCALAPKMYVLEVGLDAFKGNAIDLKTQFPLLRKYMDAVFERESFRESFYPRDTLIWGWSNARKK